MDRLPLKWVLEVPDLQVRAPRDGAAVQADVVQRYADLLLEGVEFPPVLVMRVAAGLPQVMVLDGRHRLAAHRLAGREDIAVEHSEAKDIRAGLEVALKANGAHGLPRSREDLRHCIGLADKLWPEVSDREIARRLGCGHSWVSEVRRKVAPVLAVECPVPDTDASTSNLHEGFEGQVMDETRDDAQIDGTQQRSVALAIGVDHGSEPPTQGVVEPRPAEAAWVEDVDQELAGMGPGRVLLASGEAEVPVAREVKRHRGQDPLERWYTPEAMAAVCWRWLLGSGLLVNPMPKQPWVLRLLEPCVGGGAWLTGLEVASVQRPEVAPARAWTIRDLDPEAPGLKLWRQRTEEAVVGDVTTMDFFGGGFDVAISNPPNSRALDVIMACLDVVRPGGLVVMLMPANWMAAKRRRAWLKMYPPEVVAWAPWRPSFEGPAAELQETDGGSPPQEYALHVWRVGAAPGARWTGTWVEDFGNEEVEDGEE